MAPAEVTRLLDRAGSGDRVATAELFPLVYDELRRLSEKYLADEAAGHTLQPTALVHEAYLRLVGPGETTWENRRHFFGAAAQAIRRILTDHARAKGRIKRGGDQKRVSLECADVADKSLETDLVGLDEALTQLAAFDPNKAGLVELKFYGGLSVEEIARSMGVSESTVAREWRFARAWLHRALACRPSNA